jgi:hypothetical protein
VSAIRRSIYALLDAQQQDLVPPVAVASSPSVIPDVSSLAPGPEGPASADPSPRNGGLWRRQLGGTSTGAGAVGVADVLAIPANRVCAECDSEPVAWVSLKFYTLMCAECKGIHQELFQEGDLVSIKGMREKRAGKETSHDKLSCADDFPSVLTSSSPSPLSCANTRCSLRPSDVHELGGLPSG